MQILKCGHCGWVFEHTHSENCPRCNGVSKWFAASADDDKTSELHNQPTYREKQLIAFSKKLDRDVQSSPCCYKHTVHRGWQGHDLECPNWVMVY